MFLVIVHQIEVKASYNFPNTFFLPSADIVASQRCKNTDLIVSFGFHLRIENEYKKGRPLIKIISGRPCGSVFNWGMSYERFHVNLVHFKDRQLGILD